MDLSAVLEHLHHRHFKTPYIVTYTGLAFFTLVFNGLFIYTVVLSKGLHNTTNKILLSLAVSDFLTGAVVLPIFIINALPDVYLHPVLCVALNCVLTTGNLVAGMHLLIVTIERYVAILYPLRHRLMIVSRKLSLMIAVCWVPPIILGSTPLMGWNYYSREQGSLNATHCHMLAAITCSYYWFYIGILVVVLVITWWCYVHMFVIARRRTHSSPEQRNTLQRTNVPLSSGLKAVKVLMSTVVYNTLTTVPVSILHLFHCQGFDLHLYYWLLCMSLFYSNSVMDPLIYGLGQKSIRDTFVKTVLKRLCGRCFRSRYHEQSRPTPSTISPVIPHRMTPL